MSKIENALSKFCTSLESVSGGKLLSVIHYEPASETSGLRVLVVMDELNDDIWQRLGNAYSGSARRNKITPMLMTWPELQQSTDVFPLTFLEMKRSYRVIYGDDLLAKLDIRHTHLRLRCEQELKNSLFRMQSAFLRHAESRNQLLAAIAQHFGAFKRSLIGCSFLYGQTPPRDDAQLFDNAASNMNLHGETLSVTQTLLNSDKQHDLEFLKGVFIGLMSQIRIAANVVDDMADETQIIELLEPDA